MKVEWYSNKVKPSLPFCDKYQICVAVAGSLILGYKYDLPTNTLTYYGSDDDDISHNITLSSNIVDGWCYVKDLYPSETKF